MAERTTDERQHGFELVQYVRLRKQALGVRVTPEPYVPQQYASGQEAQVYWYGPMPISTASRTRTASIRSG